MHYATVYIYNNVCMIQQLINFQSVTHCCVIEEEVLERLYLRPYASSHPACRSFSFRICNKILLLDI